MPERLSFCMVTTFYPPHHFGGDAVYVQRLSDALARRGHRVTVVHAPEAFASLGGKPGPEPASHENVTVRPVRSGLGAAGPLAVYLTGRPALHAREFGRIFAAERFDVVHFHNVSLIGGPGVLRYGAGVKLYTMLEHWLVCPMHVLWKLNRELCERPQCIRCSLAFRRPPQLWRYTPLLERSTAEVDLFLSPSRFTMRAHRERGFDRPIEHLPLFVAPEEPRAGDGSEHPRPYALFVGRLERIKGAHTLIEAFRRYRGCDQLIAGTGTQEASLRRQAGGLDHVHFLGQVEHARLRRLYAGAVALVVPSLEAFAESTPVLVRDLGGLPEVVEDSGGGFVFSEDDEIGSRLEQLRGDPELRAELGRRGREALGRLWAEEPHLERYLELVERLRAARAAPSGAGSKLGRS